jgi:hypothetical protein
MITMVSFEDIMSGEIILSKELLMVMNMQEKPASEEIKIALCENMGRTICDLLPVLEAQIKVFKTLKNNIESSASPTDTKNIFYAFLSLSNYSLYMNIELYSVLRSSFKASLPFERRYNLKYINIIILEGYKHLYGYKNIIKNSLWYKIQSLLDVIKDEELRCDYLALDEQIKQFGEDRITDKDQRDFALHYDLEPVSVYNMLMEISEENEVQRVLQFGKLLENIFSFTLKYEKKYVGEVKIDLNFENEHDFSYCDIDPFRSKHTEIYSMLEKRILTYSDQLDYFIRLQKIPEILKVKFKDISEEYLIHINQIIEITKTNIQLIFLYIDLASATRAFLSSEYIIERQLSLKQINIITYEGFNKLYGINDNKKETFLEKYLQPIISMSKDSKIISEFCQLKQELNVFEIETKKMKEKRHVSVHYYEGIENVYDMLQHFNPFIEFYRSVNFLNLLTKILNISYKCLAVIDLHQNAFFKEKTAKTTESIDQIISLLEKQPKSTQIENILQKLKDIRSGEFIRKKYEKREN